MVRILSESSIAAGTRRIEAVAGLACVRYSRHTDQLLGEVARELGCTEAEVVQRLQAVQERVRQLEKELAAARRLSARINVAELVAGAQQIVGVPLVASVVPGADREVLKSLADQVIDRLGSGATLLGAEVDGKVALVAKVSQDLVERGAHAGLLVKTAAESAGGGGGGAPSFAQAGGGDPGRLQEAVQTAAATLAAQLGGQ